MDDEALKKVCQAMLGEGITNYLTGRQFRAISAICIGMMALKVDRKTATKMIFECQAAALRRCADMIDESAASILAKIT